MERKKNFIEIEIDAALMDLLPETVQLILQKLSLEKNLAIKGGVARLVLLEALKELWGDVDEKRLEIEQKINDLDLILIHSTSLGKSKDALKRKEEAIRERLKGVSVIFHGQDIEPVKSKKGGLNNDTIEKILKTRDLTINQVLLISLGNTWLLVCTNNCRRDVYDGVGMLCPGETKVTRYDLGRIIAGGRGLFRLIRFLAKGKVNKIWLPQWMLEAHLTEMREQQREGKIPVNGNLGFSGKILSGQFERESDNVKERLITILRKLGITDTHTFQEYRDEQFGIFPDTDEKIFDPDLDMSFSDRIDEILEQQKKRQESQQGRNKERNTCKHEYQTFKCHGCEQRCEIKKCKFCTDWILPEQDLACNKIFIAGNREKNPEGLITIDFNASKK